MFRNALVGVDGSHFGRDAVALASRLLADGGSLTLVHVHPGRLHPLHAVTPGVLDEERAASEKLLTQERERAGVQAELISAVGSSPGAILHEQAEERGADLLVVGSSRRGVLGRVMLGDDTRRALNGAPCAVAIAARAYAEAPGPLARIGVGYNDSAESRAALQAARAIAGHAGVTIKALEVISIPTYAYGGMMAPSVGQEIDTVLQEADARMRALDGVEGRAAYGLTGEELAAFSDQLDLLVVGSRSYGPFKRLVVGSTSEYLERHARCSLLVLPRSAAQDGREPAGPVPGCGARLALTMRAIPTAPVAAGALIAGYAVAATSGSRPLGGLVLAAGGLWCLRAWDRRNGRRTAVVLGSVGTGAFVLSHVLAPQIGAWPSVLTVAGATAVAATLLSDRRPPVTAI